MKLKFKEIAIIGVGLMGGSLGLALRKRGFAGRIIGLGRDKKKLNRAIKLGAIDMAETNWYSGVQNAQLVLICTPVGRILPVFNDLLPYFPKGCILTDVGSTKKSIVTGAEQIIRNSKKEIYFIGSHPMTGSEKSGIEAAREDLYENALCLITPTRYSNKTAIRKVSELWKKVGCRVVELSPAAHDRAVAAVSHLPHILASSLVNTIARLDNKTGDLWKLTATGFRDTTRIAGSHPQIWTDICLENRNSILELIEIFKKELDSFAIAIKKENQTNIYQKFNMAKIYRDAIKNPK